MMFIDLSIYTFNDTILWMTLINITLLITSEIIQPYAGNQLIIMKKRLKRIQYIMILLYLLLIVIKINEIIITR